MMTTASSSPDVSASGLSSASAAKLLQQFGPNALPEEPAHPIRQFFSRLWAPVPWMLEVTIILELVLRRRLEAMVIAILLLLNALLSLVQERKAENALALLRKRLPVKARVLRDGAWQQIDATQIVPGDRIYVRMGDIVPADLRITQGQLSIDQSMLTGESLPVDAGAGAAAYAGAIVRRGEASGEVTATGARTYFGKTANLVNSAQTVSHLQSIIFRIVQYLIALDVILVAALLIFALHAHLPLRDMLPFALILLVASVPVALPATFTLSTALGAEELARRGVMVTRLSAIEEAAAMEILLSDKTGTITQNQLAVAALRVYAPFHEEDLLRYAALASDDANQDPLDLAVLQAAEQHSIDRSAIRRSTFVPFDTATKMSRAGWEKDGVEHVAIKGFPAAVTALAAAPAQWPADLEGFAKKGYRVLAVAAGPADALQLCGLIAFEDPPREDSARQIAALTALGVRVVMVTGDAPETAAVIAEQVGIGSRVCQSHALQSLPPQDYANYDVFAGIYPADKSALVKAVQSSGRVTGMTGDGVNDAPALKQAEVGVAVANATDVAKASASLVLTRAGLGDITAAITTSRQIYQRMLTYTLNKIIKTIQVALFLSLGVMLTKTFVITPLLVVLLLFANDFVTMAIATDNVGYSPGPDHWDIRPLMMTAGVLATCLLLFSAGAFLAARHWLALPLGQLQTLDFLMLVFTGQATVYLVRERKHFWQSRPGKLLIVSSLLDVAIVILLATNGVLMSQITILPVMELLAGTILFMVFLDAMKIRIFQWFGIR